MSKSNALEPAVSIATAYKVSQNILPILCYSQALQPVCSQSGVVQTATPGPSPSA